MNHKLNLSVYAETGDFWEQGVISTDSQGKRKDLDEACTLLHTEGLRAVADSFPTQFVRYHKGFRELELIKCAAEHRNTRVAWVWGPTGVGKTRGVYAAAKELGWTVFPKDATKWWDGYIDQQLVLLDDMRGHHHDYAWLLRLFDIYPMYVEFKGGSRVLRASAYVVTTTSSLRSTFADSDEEDIKQMERRVQEHVVVDYEEVCMWLVELFKTEHSSSRSQTSDTRSQS